jgi:hypothetical protein
MHQQFVVPRFFSIQSFIHHRRCSVTDSSSTQPEYKSSALEACSARNQGNYDVNTIERLEYNASQLFCFCIILLNSSSRKDILRATNRLMRYCTLL